MISRVFISMKGQNDDDDDYCYYYYCFGVLHHLLQFNFPVSYSFLDIDCYSFISQELTLLYIHYKLRCLIIYFYFISDVYFTIWCMVLCVV